MTMTISASRSTRSGFAALSSLLLCAVASAHGDWPAQHGGIMNEGGETSFELIQKDKRTTVCLSDHGKPLATQGASGTLSLKRGDKETSHAMTPVANGNCLVATGTVATLRAGDAAITRVEMGNGSVVIGRFKVNPK